MEEQFYLRSNDRLRFLGQYEEVIGQLYDLSFVDGFLIAQIGNILVAFPPEVESIIKPFIGQRIAILHTDIPGKQFLVRIAPIKMIKNKVTEPGGSAKRFKD